MKNLTEIRIMQDLTNKKRIPVNSVSEKQKKAFKSLQTRGLIKKENNFWVAA